MPTEGKTDLRVLLVFPRDEPAGGGAWRVARILAESLRGAGVDAHLLFAYGPPTQRRGSAPAFFLEASGRLDRNAWSRARNLVRELDPDVIHMVEPVLWLRMAWLGVPKPFLLHVHGRLLWQEMSRKDRLIWRFVPFLVDAFVCISRPAAQTLVDLGVSPRERVFTLYNATDPAHFRPVSPPLREQARLRLGLPADRLLAGMVCRLVEQRGLPEAIQLLEMLGSNWHLVLCGDGPYRAPLQALVRERKLEKRVHWLGWVEEVESVYHALDAYLFLARYDAFGLAMAEAMASGIPVFGLGGLGEYRDPTYPLVTPRNAVFVERRRPWELHAIQEAESLRLLAGSLSSYARHPEAFQPMVRRARNWVRDRFSPSRQAREMISIYRQLLQRPSATLVWSST